MYIDAKVDIEKKKKRKRKEGKRYKQNNPISDRSRCIGLCTIKTRKCTE